VVTGDLRPGTFVRLERVASELGVSVTPVREALMQLRAEGFVAWRPRRGFEVLPLTAEDVLDVYEVQAFIAGQLAARAVSGLNDRDLAELEKIQNELESAHADDRLEDVERLNHNFHRAINRAADSPRLTWSLLTTAKFAPRLFFARIDGWSDSSAHDHRAVLAALTSREPAHAAEAMRAHIQRAGTLLARHLTELSKAGPRG
jgi:DNA-binding GntR family transcriptional regulator